MTWPKQNKEDPGWLRGLEPDEVLDELAGPSIFTSNTERGMVLAYLVDIGPGWETYFVAPCTDDTVVGLKSGALSVRQALVASWAFLAKLDDDGVESCWSLNLKELPLDKLPKDSIMLWPHLQPLLSLRAVGAGIGVGKTPSKLVVRLAQGARDCMKMLTEYAAGSANMEALRTLWDLPVQRFAHRSFEVSFGAPSSLPEAGTAAEEEATTRNQRILQEAGLLLESGLAWAAVDTQESIEPESALEATAAPMLPESTRRVVLSALKKIMPQTRGVEVDEIHIGGLLTGSNTPVILDHRAVARVRAGLTGAAASEYVRTYNCLVRMVDKDKTKAALLSDESGSVSVKIEEDLLMEVIAALGDERKYVATVLEDDRENRTLQSLTPFTGDSEDLDSDQA